MEQVTEKVKNQNKVGKNKAVWSLDKFTGKKNSGRTVIKLLTSSMKCILWRGKGWAFALIFTTVRISSKRFFKKKNIISDKYQETAPKEHRTVHS